MFPASCVSSRVCTLILVFICFSAVTTEEERTFGADSLDSKRPLKSSALSDDDILTSHSHAVFLAVFCSSTLPPKT